MRNIKHLAVINAFMLDTKHLLTPEQTRFIEPVIVLEAIRNREIASDKGQRGKALVLIKNLEAVGDEDIQGLLMKISGNDGPTDVVAAGIIAAFGHSVTQADAGHLRNVAQQAINRVRRSKARSEEKTSIKALLSFFRDSVEMTTYHTEDGAMAGAGAAIDRAAGMRPSDSGRAASAD